MSAFTCEQASEYLACVKALKKSYRFYDVHVHPYEVLFDNFSYEADPARRGMLRISGSSKGYVPPAVGTPRLQEAEEMEVSLHPAMMQRIAQLHLTRSYGHVGAPVFEDAMQLSGVDRALLLPVAPAREEIAHRLRWIREIYPDADRFWLAGSVSGATKETELSSSIKRQQQEFGIRAVKCHPVVSEIDLGSEQGRSWLETLLCVCGSASLPLVLHTGRNSPYWGGARGAFACLDHLTQIDWSLSQAPVILAHGGIYRCSSTETEEKWLPTLKKMLEAHQNLFLDLSNLGIGALKLLLRSIPLERLLFGSDALYVPQWVALTTLLHAFTELGMRVEESAIRLASGNPQRVVFRE